MNQITIGYPTIGPKQLESILTEKSPYYIYPAYDLKGEVDSIHQKFSEGKTIEFQVLDNKMAFTVINFDEGKNEIKFQLQTPQSKLVRVRINNRWINKP